MRILLLTQILPYPPNAGPRVKTWHVLKDMLARGNEVHLVSFVREDEREHLPVLEALCTDVIPVPIQRSSFKNLIAWFRSLFTRKSFLIMRDDVPEMRTVVDALLQQRDFDILYADQITMTQFATAQGKGSPAEFRIFDAHNATWVIMDRMRKDIRFWLRPMLALEMVRIREYERKIITDFEHTLVVTDIDRDALLSIMGDPPGANAVSNKISVVPITIDTEALVQVKRDSGSMKILTVGTLHYQPNADGILWFLQKVFPLIRKEIPGASLTIVGKNPPESILKRAKQWPENVEVTGYVRDLNPYFEQSAVIIVPVLAGSGMRVRILESFARGMPIVTTSIGLEGIEATPGGDVEVADTPKAFASSVIRILEDQTFQSTLSMNGRELVVKRYDWRVALRAMDSVYAMAEQHRTQYSER